MAMLNFKHGSYANLFKEVEGVKQVPISNGTIYVTTDEKAMYVDLNDERIRLSQIITCTYNQWVDLKPPYSTEAFYYIIDKNALLKYNDGSAPAGSDESVVAGWVQINSTKALQESLNSLRGDFETLSGTVASQGTAITGLTTRIGDLEKTHGDDISRIDGEIDVLEGAFASLEDAINATNRAIGFIGVVNEVPAVTDANRYDVCECKGKLYILMPGANEGDPDVWAEYQDIVANIEDIKRRISGMATDTNMQALTTRVQQLEAFKATLEGENGILAGLRTDVDAAKAQADQGVADAATAQAAAEAAQAAADKAQAQADKGVTDAATALTAAQGAQTTADEAKAAAGVADDKAVAAQGAAEAAQGTADEALADAKKANEAIGDENGGLVKDIADNKSAAAAALTAAQGAQETADGAQEAAEAAQEAADKAQADATQALTNAATADGKAVAAQGTADEALGKANANASSITGLTTRIGAEEEARAQAISDLRDEIIGNLQTADAMKFEGTVSSLEALNAISGVAKGATYKATSEFVIGEGDKAVYVYVGDLLIANGDEDAETGLITGEIKWEHVPSGYVADYNPEMTVEAGNNTAEVKLTSGAAGADEAGDLGKFSVSAEADSAITVTAAGTNIVVGMTWSEF